MRAMNRPSDRQVERVIGMLLRVGVVAAAAVVLAGGVLYLVQRGGGHPSYKAFDGEPPGLRAIPSILRGSLSLDGRSVIQAGLLLLIAVPVLRVAVSIVAFALERDWVYCLVTAIVLAVLIFSLLGGGG
jgi:uncharacterized membrane protein